MEVNAWQRVVMLESHQATMLGGADGGVLGAMAVFEYPRGRLGAVVAAPDEVPGAPPERAIQGLEGKGRDQLIITLVMEPPPLCRPRSGVTLAMAAPARGSGPSFAERGAPTEQEEHHHAKGCGQEQPAESDDQDIAS